MFGVKSLNVGLKPCSCGRPVELKYGRPGFTAGGSCRSGKRLFRCTGNRRTTLCVAGAESGTVPGGPGCEYEDGSVLKVMAREWCLVGEFDLNFLGGLLEVFPE